MATALAAAGALVLTAGLIGLAASPASAGNHGDEDDSGELKSYVCKYVARPGQAERLQTGQNPIWVANSSIQGYDPGVHGDVEDGDTFSDKHVKSVVISANSPRQDPEPTIEDCDGGEPFDQCPTELPGDQGPGTPCTKSPDEVDVFDSEMNCVAGYRSRAGETVTAFVYDEQSDVWVPQSPVTTWGEWSSWQALTAAQYAQLKCRPGQPDPTVVDLEDERTTCAGVDERFGTRTTSYVWNETSRAYDAVVGAVVWGDWAKVRDLTDDELLAEGCVLGEETILPEPKPDKKPTKVAQEPTVKGVQVVVPQEVAPEAAVPTAVAAGFAGAAGATTQLLAQVLVAGGLLLLLLGGWVGLGQREGGAHEA